MGKKVIIVEFGKLLVDFIDGKMILRPNLDELMNKLSFAKKNGVEVILETKSNMKESKEIGQEQLLERFFQLKPEFRTIFDVKDRSKAIDESEQYESKLYIGSETPFDKEKFFVEGNRHISSPDRSFYENLEARGYSFLGEGLEYSVNEEQLKAIMECAEISKKHPEILPMLRDFLEQARKDPGCDMMYSAIDSFIEGKYVSENHFKKGKYSEAYSEYKSKLSDLENEMWVESNLVAEEPVVIDLDEHLKSDTFDIYEGIELPAQTELQKKDAELSSLEAEEQIITEAEALIGKQTEKSGEQK